MTAATAEPEAPAATVAAPQKRQNTLARFAWFLAGSGVNYVIIATPLHWLENHTQLPDFAISATSMGVSALFFFFWNYFVNFRTDARRHHALARYAIAVGCMWLLSSTLLGILKQFDAHMHFSIAGKMLDLDIVATQFFLGGLKFFLYHKWVFPVSKTTAATNPLEK